MGAPPNRHAAGGNSGIDKDQAEKLWNHIRALETLNEQKEEVNDDIKARKAIAKEDGFDTNIMAVILKRRKAGQGQTLAADDLLALYEGAIREVGGLPLEHTRQPKDDGGRSTVNEIAERLHGQPAPPDMFDQEEEQSDE